MRWDLFPLTLDHLCFDRRSVLYQPWSDHLVSLKFIVCFLVQVASPGSAAKVALVAFGLIVCVEVEKVVCGPFLVSFVAAKFEVQRVVVFVPILGNLRRLFHFAEARILSAFFLCLFLGQSSENVNFRQLLLMIVNTEFLRYFIVNMTIAIGNTRLQSRNQVLHLPCQNLLILKN